MNARAASAVALALATPACRAGTSAPFDLDWLLLVVLGAVFLVFVLVGRRKGAIAFVVLLAGALAWGRWQNFMATRAMQRAGQVLAARCLATAGSERKAAFAAVPGQVFVRADPMLLPGRSNAVRMSVRDAALTPGMQAPQSFAEPRVPGAAYVDIALLCEPIEGAGGWFLDGLRTTVTDAAGRVMALQTDYFRNPGWCLGDEPPASIEKFLREVLGRPVGLATLGEGSAERLPVRSPRGSVWPVQAGHFHEATLPDAGNPQAEGRRQLAGLPPEADCQADAGQAFDARLVCLKGTARQNAMRLAELAAVYRMPDGWLSIATPATDARQFDALAIDERSPAGEVLQRWQLRFPPVELDEAGASRIGLRNIALRGRQLTAEVVFGRRWEQADARRQRQWFERRFEVSAQLVPAPLGP